ncbi:MAG: hypothetical protein ACTSUE_07755 [Promethearchaeota archaeon]
MNKGIKRVLGIDFFSRSDTQLENSTIRDLRIIESVVFVNLHIHKVLEFGFEQLHKIRRGDVAELLKRIAKSSNLTIETRTNKHKHEPCAISGKIGDVIVEYSFLYKSESFTYTIGSDMTDAVNVFPLLYSFSQRIISGPLETNANLYQEFCYASEYIQNISKMANLSSCVMLSL